MGADLNLQQNGEPASASASSGLWALGAIRPALQLAPAPHFGGGIACRGRNHRIHNARQAVLRVVADNAPRDALMRAVAVTVCENEGDSAIAVMASELRALCRALDRHTVRVSENADNIGMIAGALRAAGDELESISGTEPDVE